MMDVSVIIPARDERGYIGMVLESLHRQDFSGSWEIIVVDNGSTDGTGDAVRKYFPRVRVIEEPHRGTHWARERGRQEAAGRVCAFIDADCVASRVWLRNGLSHFSDESIVAVTGSLGFLNTTSITLAFGAAAVSEFFYPISLWVVREIFKSGIMLGGNSFIRADALHAINGFDTRIEFWGDDTNTAVRLAQIGRIVYGKDVYVETSDRRYMEEGILRTLWGYTYQAMRAVRDAQRTPIPSESTRS